MDDVTDIVFREVIAETARPDVFFTEFTNVDGLQSVGREKLLPRLKYTESERPIVAQIWGLQPKNYFEVAKQLKEMGFDGIDINMGCPQRNVIRSGSCSALIKNRNLAKKIGKLARKRVVRDFNIIETARDYERLYSEL